MEAICCNYYTSLTMSLMFLLSFLVFNLVFGNKGNTILIKKAEVYLENYRVEDEDFFINSE
jgi:hypothetical protein